jgi:hypothetical protein
MVQQLQKLLEQLPRQTTGTDGVRQKLRQAMKALEGKLKSLPESVPLGKPKSRRWTSMVGDFDTLCRRANSRCRFVPLCGHPDGQDGHP